MPRAQHFFPASQPEQQYHLEQPGLKIGFILLPLFEVRFHFLFSDALLWQAFSSGSTIMQRPHVEIPSEYLHDPVTYISKRDSGTSVSQLRLSPSRNSILCSTPSVFRAVHCRWFSRD